MQCAPLIFLSWIWWLSVMWMRVKAPLWGIYCSSWDKLIRRQCIAMNEVIVNFSGCVTAQCCLDCQSMGKATFQFAWVLDSHEEERKPGVTMDVAVNAFETEHRIVCCLPYFPKTELYARLPFWMPPDIKILCQIWLLVPLKQTSPFWLSMRPALNLNPGMYFLFSANLNHWRVPLLCLVSTCLPSSILLICINENVKPPTALTPVDKLKSTLYWLVAWVFQSLSLL